VEVKQNDHFTITWLENSMFDVVVQDVDFVSTNGSETET
jgi:hypothetical protein